MNSYTADSPNKHGCKIQGNKKMQQMHPRIEVVSKSTSDKQTKEYSPIAPQSPAHKRAPRRTWNQYTINAKKGVLNGISALTLNPTAATPSKTRKPSVKASQTTTLLSPNRRRALVVPKHTILLEKPKVQTDVYSNLWLERLKGNLQNNTPTRNALKDDVQRRISNGETVSSIYKEINLLIEVS